MRTTLSVVFTLGLMVSQLAFAANLAVIDSSQTTIALSEAEVLGVGFDALPLLSSPK